MRSAACASMGARRAWDEEPAGVSDGVAVRPSCRTDGTTRWPTDWSRLRNTGGEGSPALRSSAASVRHGDDGATERLIDGREATAHPYLARQMSDHGFRQTLEV